MTEHHLTIGSHETFEHGSCLLELVAHQAGEPHTDSPACVLPPLSAAGRGLNDAINEDARRDQLLLPLVRLMLNTAGGDAHKVSLEWVDWTTRVYLPTWLDLVPALSDHAAALRALPEVADENAKAAGVVVWAARAAAGNAARAAARAAARGAAGGAAWDAAWDAARAAAGNAAWAAARAAAGNAARAAAWDAARAAAGGAAWDAAWAAARAAAGNAARAAAWDALEPTVHKLQESAVALLRRQCEEASPAGP